MGSSNDLRVLEITVISGEDLRINRKQPVKKNAFVTIKTDSFKEQTTKMDKDGGGYPAWDEKFVMDMPMHARYFTAEVRCKTAAGSRIVGTAVIPASDFLGDYVPENYLHFLSYRLWDCHGERNGILNLSVRVKSSSSVRNAYGGGCSSHSAGCSRPWSGIAVGGQQVSNGEGVVTGIPVWS
ncbi:BON1-associated protein 2-like [Coffea arabica]|uniref:BON1-associated protein 2-like n=1 Tax=Coffea arabica TaxID=13443 RepID=A0A6P6W1X4_COFAR|nr:BON1-associated protein 2-like [Coffea arabica]XP_027108197.1 BON1-associated protein 2-like [Coffea arabica]